jgi:hypothetical protein
MFNDSHIIDKFNILIKFFYLFFLYIYILIELKVFKPELNIQQLFYNVYDNYGYTTKS